MMLSLEVNEWMANKIANEKNRRYVDIEVFGTLRETEKAVELVFASDTNGVYTSWCPKSQLRVVDASSDQRDGNSENGVRVEADLEEVIKNYHFDSYQDAKDQFNDTMSMYR